MSRSAEEGARRWQNGDGNLKAKAVDIHHRLIGVFGYPPRRPRLDPIAQLVSAVISQNTNDTLRDRAFALLLQRFPSWVEVRDAPVEEIAEAIRVAGLAEQKAGCIKGALRLISREQGQLSLDFLGSLGVEEAKKWLTSIRGIGPKTAAIILLFALGKAAFPVDTHIHRVTRRLGLVPANTSREKAQERLEAIVPSELYYTFHLNLIRHGREVCQARRPRCDACVLQQLCDATGVGRGDFSLDKGRAGCLLWISTRC